MIASYAVPSWGRAPGRPPRLQEQACDMPMGRIAAGPKAVSMIRQSRISWTGRRMKSRTATAAMMLHPLPRYTAGSDKAKNLYGNPYETPGHMARGSLC